MAADWTWPPCERPQLAEPGSSAQARACGECVGCHYAERHAQATAEGRVLIELRPAHAERLSLIARYPAKHQGGDNEIAQTIDEAIEAFMRGVERMARQ